MSFIQMLKAKHENPVDMVSETKKLPKNLQEKQEKKPEELLRGNNFKIRLITPTAFGTEFILAREYDKEEIEKTLAGFNVKIKGKSVFIVE